MLIPAVILTSNDSSADNSHALQSQSRLQDPPENGSTMACEIASEQGMDLKDTMYDNPKSERYACVRMRPGRHGFCNGFSICLFLMVMAVCGWVMHRRLSQYDTPQQAIHQSTSIKVTVTKRNPISVPSQHGTDAIALFLLAFAITATLKSPENSKTAVAYRVQRRRSDQHADVSLRSRLDRFFLLPPPSPFSEL